MSTFQVVLFVAFACLLVYKMVKRGAITLPSFHLPMAIAAVIPDAVEPVGNWLTDEKFVAGMQEAFELAKVSTVSFNHNRIMFVSRDTGKVMTLKLSSGWKDESEGFVPLTPRRAMPQFEQVAPEGY